MILIVIREFLFWDSLYFYLLKRIKSAVIAPTTYINAMADEPAVSIGTVVTISATTCNIVKRNANVKNAL